MRRRLIVGVWVAFLALGVYAALTNSTALPPPARVRALQLQQPFTLTYLVGTEWFNESRPVRDHWQLTLSYDGRNMLYVRRSGKTGRTVVCLYGGDQTWEMPNGAIEPGFDFGRMMFCPLPGVGLPYMPLLRIGAKPAVEARIVAEMAPNVAAEQQKVDPELYRTAGRDRDYGIYNYADDVAGRAETAPGIMPLNGVASVVSVPCGGVPKVLWYDTFDLPGHPFIGHLWEFYDHERFEGLWLARKIRMRWFDTMRRPNGLAQSATYELQSAVARPLEARAYDAASYMGNHASITDLTTRTVRTFGYQAGKGTLQEQRQSEMPLRQALTLAAKSPVNTGLVGLCVALVAGATCDEVYTNGGGGVTVDSCTRRGLS